MFSEISSQDAQSAQAPHVHVAKEEVDVVVAAIKTGDVLYCGVSDYMLRTLVEATITAVDEYRATGTS